MILVFTATFRCGVEKGGAQNTGGESGVQVLDDWFWLTRLGDRVEVPAARSGSRG
jgi:hypothetical protein